MQTKIIEYFANIILPLFPEVKDAEPRPGIDYFKMDLSWLLHNDPNRPNKGSKTIRIIISQEQIADYENLHSNEQSQFDAKLKNFITCKKSQLDPNHNNPSYALPPIEEWHVVV